MAVKQPGAPGIGNFAAYQAYYSKPSPAAPSSSTLSSGSTMDRQTSRPLPSGDGSKVLTITDTKTGQVTYAGSGGRQYSTQAGALQSEQLARQAAQKQQVFESDLLQQSFRTQAEMQKAEQEFKRTQSISAAEEKRRDIVSGVIAKEMASPVTARELAQDLSRRDTRDILPSVTKSESRLQTQTQVQREFFSPTFQEARLAAGQFYAMAGVSLTGKVDEQKQKEFESRLQKREERIRELEKDAEPIKKEASVFKKEVEEFNREVEEFNKQSDLLKKEVGARDLKPDEETIFLSETDMGLFQPRIESVEKEAERLAKRESELGARRATFEMTEGQLIAREKAILKDYEDITSSFEQLQEKEGKLNVFGLAASKSIGYDLKDFELDYTPKQRGKLDFFASPALATRIMFGQEPLLKEPSLEKVEDIGKLATFEGQRRAIDMVTKPFDFIDAGSRIIGSGFALGTIGAVAGSTIGSKIPILGTGIGFVAGGVVGFKTGLLSGTADVLTSETVGRIMIDEELGRSAGVVAGITTAVGAGSLLLKKETAKRFVTETGKPVFKLETKAGERVIKDGLFRKSDLKAVEQATKGSVRVPFTTTIKADTSLLNRIFVGVKDTVLKTSTPKVSQIKIGTVDLSVQSVVKGGVLITKTTFPDGTGAQSTLPIKGGVKTDFVSDIVVTSKFVQKGTIRDKLTSFFSKQDKRLVSGFENQGVVKLYLDKPSSLFQKTVSRFKGERFVEDRFKDVGRVEALGWQPIAKTKKGTIELFMDRITTGSGLDGFQLTKLLSGKKDYLGVSISKDWGTGSITQTQFVGQKVSGKFAFGKQQSPIIDTGKMLPDSSMRLLKPFFDKNPMTQSQALSYIESLSKQTLAPKVVAKQTVKTIEDQGAKIATQIINTMSQPKNLGSIYGSVVLTRQSQLSGYTGQEQVLVSDVSFTQPQVGRTDFAQPQAVTVDRVVDKLRVDVGTQPVLRTGYDTLLRTDFGRTTDKFRVDSGVKQLEKLRTDYAFVTQPRVRQSELLGLKEMFSTKSIEKTRLDLKQLELIRLDFPTLPSVPRITTPTIPVTPPFVPLSGWGRMDVGAGLGGFARRKPVPRTKPLVAIKSDLFRKFVSGETDLLVSPENVGLVKRIRARRGSLLGIIPTKEQLKKKKKKGELTEEELLKRFGVF